MFVVSTNIFRPTFGLAYIRRSSFSQGSTVILGTVAVSCSDFHSFIYFIRLILKIQVEAD